MRQPAVAVEVAVVLGAYLVGSIPLAWVLGRWARGVDLRQLGSGNPGTSNLFRNTGIGLAVLSGPLQFAQGVVPVVVARAVGGDDVLLDLCAGAAVLGNGWPIWFGFNGQRCIAVATGAVAAISPALLGLLLVCFAAGALTHAIAVGVLAGFTILPLAAWWISGGGLAITCGALLAAVVLRRLEGIGTDLRRARSLEEKHVLVRRLLLDERPGQVLVGPREEPNP